MSKKILVSGANGFVGQHLLKEFDAHKIETIGIGGPDSYSDRSSWLSLDLLDPRAVSEIDFRDVSGVVHLAGLAAVGPSYDEPMRYVETNVGIEVNLFEAARAQKARPRFLIISSGALYDPSAKQPLNEKSEVVPNSPYAVSKLSQEYMALYYQRIGFECIITRPFNHIGPGQGPGFIVPDLAEQIVSVARGRQQEIKVGNLDAKRDYTDVRDIVRAYRLLLEKGKPGATYNVCSGTVRSGHEILSGLMQAAGVNYPVKQDPAKLRPSDTPVLMGSHDKLTADTGWLPEIPLNKTLSDVIAELKLKA